MPAPINVIVDPSYHGGIPNPSQAAADGLVGVIREASHGMAPVSASQTRTRGTLPARRLALSASLALLLVHGCTANIPAVRDFSKETIVAAGTFDNVADDLPKSCTRRVGLEFAPDEKLTIERNTVEYTQEYRDALAKCDSLKQSLNGILEVNAVLKGYAEALGQLASDDAVTFTAEMDALEASLARIEINGNNPFGGARAAAVSGLARYLSNAALNGYRQKELRKTIEIGQQHLDEIVGGLDDVAGDYQALLRNEKQNVVTHQNLIIVQRKKGGSTADLDDKLLQTKLAIESIETRERAADDYKRILAKVAETHKGLYVSATSDELDSALLIAEIQRYVAELTPLINQIRVAYADR